MGGMPSARGCEWKGRPDERAHERFQAAFDAIPRDEQGNMVVEPADAPKPVEPSKLPRSCVDCKIHGAQYDDYGDLTLPPCEVSCANGSVECLARHEKMGNQYKL